MRSLKIFAAALMMVGVIVPDLALGQGPGGRGGPGGGQGGRGGRPSFERLIQAFDANGDGALEESEVPARVWARLSQADANEDGYVDQTEFDSFRPGQP